ncbi:unnamed protein product [Acanthosepion pharaonis]|uniref:Uncharacterized protein n=1 Tax=Acanthosepion pharaonis TaxID=158019 RepID=A0A812BDE9_ACAPH|nr:unnamed protein product [Sepia pharaonis]
MQNISIYSFFFLFLSSYPRLSVDIFLSISQFLVVLFQSHYRSISWPIILLFLFAISLTMFVLVCHSKLLFFSLSLSLSLSFSRHISFLLSLSQFPLKDYLVIFLHFLYLKAINNFVVFINSFFSFNMSLGFDETPPIILFLYLLSHHLSIFCLFYLLSVLLPLVVFLFKHNAPPSFSFNIYSSVCSLQSVSLSLSLPILPSFFCSLSFSLSLSLSLPILPSFCFATLGPSFFSFNLFSSLSLSLSLFSYLWLYLFLYPATLLSSSYFSSCFLSLHYLSIYPFFFLLNCLCSFSKTLPFTSFILLISLFLFRTHFISFLKAIFHDFYNLSLLFFFFRYPTSSFFSNTLISIYLIILISLSIFPTHFISFLNIISPQTTVSSNFPFLLSLFFSLITSLFTFNPFSSVLTLFIFNFSSSFSASITCNFLCFFNLYSLDRFFSHRSVSKVSLSFFSFLMYYLLSYVLIRFFFSFDHLEFFSSSFPFSQSFSSSFAFDLSTTSPFQMYANFFTIIFFFFLYRRNVYFLL